MNAYGMLAGVSLVVLGSATVLAQDPVKVASQVYKVVLDNPTVRVLRVSAPAGGKTPMHSHPENLVIPLSAARMRFEEAGTTQDAELAVESATFMPAQVHAGANTGSTPVDAIVIEFKAAKPGTATLPTARDNMAIKVLAESPRGVAYRATADANFHEPAGSKHEFDQIVIALSGAQMSLAIDGKPARTKWTRGDVQFIPRGAAHESKNAGGKPADFIIVAIK